MWYLHGWPPVLGSSLLLGVSKVHLKYILPPLLGNPVFHGRSGSSHSGFPRPQNRGMHALCSLLFGGQGLLTCSFLSMTAYLVANRYLLCQICLAPSGLWWYPMLQRLTFLREETEVKMNQLWKCLGRGFSRVKRAGPCIVLQILKTSLNFLPYKALPDPQLHLLGPKPPLSPTLAPQPQIRGDIFGLE